ncbi:hypothetical protein D5W64_12970 [Salmonella enterica subsp. enterica serovar Saintpaul]|nr:hypothetical protein [Salmonella enterica subsp. enterica serovar Saintpaul]
MTTSLDADFDYLDWAYGGLESLVSNPSQAFFNSLSGAESYYCLHLDAKQYAGMENKFIEGAKKAAKALYDNIMKVIKRIREYFFGEGEKAAEDAQSKAEESVSNMSELPNATPIPEDSPARNPDNYVKSLEGGAEFGEVKEENSALASAIEKVKAAALKVRDCDTVGKLRPVLIEIGKATNAGNEAVKSALRTTLSEAEKAAGKLRNVKAAEDDDTGEVKAAVKSENQANMNEAREETKKARIIGGIRNKFVSSMNAISKYANSIKEKPEESKFKG